MNKSKFSTIVSFLIFMAVTLPGASLPASANPPPQIKLAVASNFRPACEALSRGFKQRHNIEVLISSASTSTLSKQIVLGAKFDIFLSADTEHIDRLIQTGHALATSARDYAIGDLVLVSSEASEGFASLVTPAGLPEQAKLAIANPRFAPYGRAAQQALENGGGWHGVEAHLLRANNVAQALQMLVAGGAAKALVSRSLLSQLKHHKLHVYTVPEQHYDPIVQRAALLSSSQQVDEAERFLEYLLSAEGQAIVQGFGYRSAS